MERWENDMGDVQPVAVESAQAAPVGRRELAALVGALAGFVATGCAASGEGQEPVEDLGHVAEALSGTALLWVDTVVGVGRTGDLATKTSALLGNAIVVIAKGCVVAGDGGGGVFYWETTSGGENGGTIIVPTGGGGRWVRIYSGPLDVRWFGANTTALDNSDPIQKAINAAGAAGGGTVFIPPGTYATTARNLLSNVTLAGAGAAQSVLKLKDSAKEPILYTSGANNCGIRDLGFDGNNATQSGRNQSDVLYEFQPVKFNNCNDVLIENIFINRGTDASKGTFGPSAGLYITTCLRFRVLNLEVTGNGAGDGIQVLNSAKFELVNVYVHNMDFDVPGANNDQLEGISLDSCTEWTLVNPRVHDLTGNGTRNGVSHPNLCTRGIQTSNCTRFSIVGGHIAHVDQGIDLTGRPNEKWQIANVIAQDCYNFGFKCANLSRNGQVSNCTADRCGQTGFVVSPPSGTLLPVSQPNEPGPAGTGPSSDIQFVGCVAYDIGYNGNQSTHSGFRVQLGDPRYDPAPGTARGIRFIGCKAHDRQATPTMAYGFLNEVPVIEDGRYNEAIDCVSLGHTIEAYSGMHSSHCEVGRAAPQSIPNNAWTVVDWTTDVDDGGMHDTASNNSNVYARRASTYAAQFGVVFAANGTGQRGARILHNGNVVAGTTILTWPGAGGQTSVFTSTIRRLNLGANFRLEVFQDSGGPLNLQTTSGGVVEQVT